MKNLIIFCGFMIYSTSILALDQQKSMQFKLQQLKTEINKINQDLINKNQQGANLLQAIKDSDSAISNAKDLIVKLQQQRESSDIQLALTATKFNNLQQGLTQAQTTVNFAIGGIYRELLKIKQQDSLLASGDKELVNRKKMYLLKILELKYINYKQLQIKLIELNNLNSTLQKNINQLDAAIKQKSQEINQNQQQKESHELQISIIKQNTLKIQEKLSSLEQKQMKLNSLIENLKNQKIQKFPNRVAKSMTEETDKKLKRPVGGSIILGFGEEDQDGVKSNGILFNSSDESVIAVDLGNVVYTGSLAGFGQVIVIDHGNNYVSIYGGILANVVKGDYVEVGQKIANSGNSSNQPSGGIYFELRHYGRPVNPKNLSE